MIHTSILDNGVRVAIDKVLGTQTVSVGFWFVGGSRDEGEGELGLSHFLEHMLFKGTARRTAAQIALAVDRVGGALNAFTEKEVTCYHCTLPAEHLALAVDVLADMVRNSVLDAREIEKEKKVILNEIQAAEDVPEDVAHELYLEGIFGEHSIARRITGTRRNVRSVTPGALARYYGSRYGPRALLVGIAGNVEPREALDCLHRQVGGTWPNANGAPGLPPRTPPALRREWEHRPSKFGQLHVYTGYVARGAQRAQDYYRALVFSTLAGESMSSRLFQSLRETHALCYSVLSFRTNFSDLAMWTVYASTDPASGARLLDMLALELGRLRSEPPSPEEVTDAKNHLRGSLVMAREDMETRMKRLVRQLLMMGEALEYDESLERVDAVGAKEVRELVERHIQGPEFHLLAYGGRSFRGFRAIRYGF